MATATAKYRVRQGNTITHGSPPDKDGKTITKIYSAGEEIELTAEQAKSAAHAIEKGGKKRDTRTLVQRRRDAEEELAEIAKLERQQNRRSRRSDPGREEALEQIAQRPDNAASGIPSYGRVPDDHVAGIENAEEAALDAEDDLDDEPATEHGFGREGSAGTGGGGSGSSSRGEGGTGGGTDTGEDDEYTKRVDAVAADLIEESKSLDDEDEIKALKAAERKGKARTTVLAAYDDRLSELKKQS